jgi:hypothetical protein
MAAVGLSAFLPHFHRLAASGAQAYKAQVSGFPGTKGIPVSPLRKGIPPSPDLGDIAQMGMSRSSDAPNSLWPNLYYVTPEPGFWPGAGMPVQMYNPVRPQDTTMIPVPARDLRASLQSRAATLAGGIDNDRRRAVNQPFNVIRWLQRRSGNGSDQ